MEWSLRIGGILVGVCVIVLCCNAGRTAAATTLEADALLEMKTLLGIGNNVLYGWGLSGAMDSPCDWERVTCDNATSAVIGLNLTSLGLEGKISPEIASLTELQTLDISDNNLSGIIPPELGACLNLRLIDLSYNSLKGEIPWTLSELKFLQTLQLQANQLSGPIPAALSQLSNLKILNLAYNELNGEIPALLYWSQTLQVVMLRANFLTGELSPDICQLTATWYFNVRENNLTGNIPSEIGNCTSLQILDLGYNQLTGEIPRSVGFLQVSTLSLQNNNLTGAIPDVIGLLEALLILDLSYNELEGPIPLSFGRLVFLNKLYLQGNRLTGAIPSVLGNMTRAQYMLLQDNELTGTIPSELGNLPLFELRLAGNRLEGSLPVSLSTCKSLNKLDLHGNFLSGKIPEELEKLDNLTYLNLSANSLSGRIPHQLGSVINLDTLDLSNNNLSGRIPSSTGMLEHLLYLYVQGNDFSGPIPEEFGNLTSLVSLDVSHNRFNGSIPIDLGRLQQLNVLRMDHNNLSGPIPSQITGCIMLSTLNVSFNDLEGSIPVGNNFSRFPPTSFLGNPKLCGSPLESLCSWEEIRKSSSTSPVRSTTIWAAAGVAAFLIALAMFAVVKSSQFRRAAQNGNAGDKMASRVVIYHTGLVVESYDELVRITDNLTEQSMVGSGSSSKVYRCTLRSGQAVAIKQLYNHHPQNLEEFENELEILEKVKHRNLVTLRGYALSPLGHFLLYDFMENGSLYDLLHGTGPLNSKKTKLDWGARLNVALGTAQGLAYLHHDCVPRIVHRDIKTCNILLDKNLEPHISDFGIAKSVDLSTSHTPTAVVGTIGYIDPEYARTSFLTEKSDVYSYGIVLLELLTDRKAVTGEGNLHSWVLQRVGTNTFMSEGVAPDVKNSCAKTASIEKVLNLALRCTDNVPSARPSMYSVVDSLLSLISGPVHNSVKFVTKFPSSPSGQRRYMELFMDAGYYQDSSSVSNSNSNTNSSGSLTMHSSSGSDSLDSSVTDERLLAEFGRAKSDQQCMP